MKAMMARVAVVGVLFLGMFEALMQLSVHWRESREEIGSTVVLAFLLAGLIWASLRAFRGKPRRILYRSVTVVALFVLFYAVACFYSWHVRPNVGLYREPDWVAQHPGFQMQLRQQIKANMW